ncbi:MAG: transketolase C-terminal domain-containing protein [Anaerolineae bacterium]
MLKVVEGSRAIAKVLQRCRVQVISAYPITPQTHIVQDLSQIVADGDLKAEFLKVDSEFTAASAALGASAVGARAYTATASQGLLLMTEVLYNIAGLRLPLVLTCANRAISSPINIWNDQQDSVSVRDAGWIQLYAEDNQEAVDLHIQAYKISEDRRVQLPVMVCIDGFVLTHAYEPLDIPEQDEVDKFLPPYQPVRTLDPSNPLTFGMYAEDGYMETRYEVHHALNGAQAVIEEVAKEFARAFGRESGGLLQGYLLEDAEIALMATGSLVSLLKEVAEEYRSQGMKVGVLKLVSHRPFPGAALRQALQGVEKVLVFEKAVSLGGLGIVVADLRSAAHNWSRQPTINGFIVGLGGKDIGPATIRQAMSMAEEGYVEQAFLDLDQEFLEGLEKET